MFGLWGSSTTVPEYPEIATPTTDAEYQDVCDKARDSLLALIAGDGWNNIESPLEGIELFSKSIEGSPAELSRATAVVNIPFETVVADVDDLTREKIMERQKVDLVDWKLVKKLEGHKAIIYSAHHTPFPITNRELVYVRNRNDLPDGSVMIAGVSINDKNLPTEAGRVRAVVLACWLIAPHENGCHITRCIQLDPKGSIPTMLVNKHKEGAARAIDGIRKALAQ